MFIRCRCQSWFQPRTSLLYHGPSGAKSDHYISVERDCVTGWSCFGAVTPPKWHIASSVLNSGPCLALKLVLPWNQFGTSWPGLRQWKNKELLQSQPLAPNQPWNLFGGKGARINVRVLVQLGLIFPPNDSVLCHCIYDESQNHSLRCRRRSKRLGHEPVTWCLPHRGLLAKEGRGPLYPCRTARRGRMSECKTNFDCNL